MDEKYISELMVALSTVYPNLSDTFEKIRSQLPSVVAKEINHWEHEANRFTYIQQKKCIHDYKPPLNSSQFTGHDNNNILHCSKCHNTKYKTNPFRNIL
jgi:hypothetical protein